MTVLLQYRERPPTGIGPNVRRRPPITLPVATETAPDADTGFSVVSRIHPRGRPCTWWVEYGTTSSLGSETDERALPGKLGAYLREDWTSGTNGWKAGLTGVSLSHVETDGGFARYSAEPADNIDVNHRDGIGLIMLPLYGYTGKYDPGTVPTLQLGGGIPDLRGARMRMRVRSLEWTPKGTTNGTWVQVDLNDGGPAGPGGTRRANWACTKPTHGVRLLRGSWDTVTWFLYNDPHAWTYGGREDGSSNGDGYFYLELDKTLGDVNVDIFPFQILNVTEGLPPTGQIDFKWLEILYRQHSLLVASNGGTLTSSPAGGTGAAFLTDGWRNGADKEWVSGASPSYPQDFVFSFASPVVVDRVQIHNGTTKGANEYEVALSSNGTDWTTVIEDELPVSSDWGPNDLFSLNETFHLTPATHMRVRILSGNDAGECRLGEFEAFGSGNEEETDDAWYDVNQDILVAPGTYFYRVCAETDEGIATGPVQRVVVPS